MTQTETWVEREIRVPLHVPVRTRPELHGCWAVNLSLSGIGLVAEPTAERDSPGEGSILEVELSLPDDGAAIRVHGEVMWSYDTSASMEGLNSTALGLRFTDVQGRYRVALSRYFHAYKSHVAVALATDAEEAVVREALGHHTHLHFAASEEQLVDVLDRGDISAVIICGEQAALARDLMERIGRDHQLADVMPAGDLAPRIVFCARATDADLVGAFNRGLLFCVVSPPVEREALQGAVLRACADHGVRTEQRRVALALERALARERARRRPPARLEDLARDRLICKSPVMDRALQAARNVAPHKVGVLLQGETGSGKEVLARMIHDLSDRANEPFVAQDCGALTETLLESELFGHVKGSFTGAVANHPGLFVLADGGTILLDEVENTSPNMQAKLLRIIETGEVRPVGGSKTRHVDVRIIASGNRDLAEEMRKGRFRADLYFRLATFPIYVPPLRERPEDILPLANHFVARACAAAGLQLAELSQLAQQAMLAHDWPGNVRELRNAVERAVLMANGKPHIDVDLLPDAVLGLERRRAPLTVAERGSLRERMDEVEREIIRRALAEHDGVLRRAAEDLRANPVTLGRRAKRYGLI